MVLCMLLNLSHIAPPPMGDNTYTLKLSFWISQNNYCVFCERVQWVLFVGEGSWCSQEVLCMFCVKDG